MTELSPHIIFKDSTGSTLIDQIKIDNRPYNLSTAGISFMMRNAESDVLKIDNGTVGYVTDGSDGKVKYEWQATDLNSPGEYYAWWDITPSASPEFSTSEFLIVVTEHSPGVRTRTGAIYRQARSILPLTWYHLEEDHRLGDSLLQDIVESAKRSVLGTTVSVEDEETYDIRIQRFIAKLAALESISPAIDYWMNQKQSISATGTNETVSYTNRIEALRQIQEDLLRQITKDRAIIDDLLDTPFTRSFGATPVFSPGTEDGFVTPLPSKHFIDYGFPVADYKRTR